MDLGRVLSRDAARTWDGRVTGQRTHPTPEPTVWAFGSGKGGVGKSVVAGNLAVGLAHRGTRVVIVDADLGGANLHTILGMANPPRALSDFVTRRVDSLDEVLAPTPTPGLHLISGSRALMDMANPKYAQKERMLRHITSLDVDHVILDLGAGSAFNVVDFFLAAQRPVIVVLPEPTSVENTYHFIKAAYYRKLKRARPRQAVREVVDLVMAERVARGVRSPRDLVAAAASVDAAVGASLAAEAAGFAPMILANQVRGAEEHDLADDIALACRDYFGIDVRSLGGIPYDPLVTRSVVSRRPAVEQFPSSEFAAAVGALADRLTTRTAGAS